MPFINRQMIHRSIRSAMNFPTGFFSLHFGMSLRASLDPLQHLESAVGCKPCPKTLVITHILVGSWPPLSLHYVQSDFFLKHRILSKFFHGFPYVPFTHKEPLLASRTNAKQGPEMFFQMSLGMSRPYRFQPRFLQSVSIAEVFRVDLRCLINLLLAVAS